MMMLVVMLKVILMVNDDITKVRKTIVLKVKDDAESDVEGK